MDFKLLSKLITYQTVVGSLAVYSNLIYIGLENVDGWTLLLFFGLVAQLTGIWLILGHKNLQKCLRHVDKLVDGFLMGFLPVVVLMILLTLLISAPNFEKDDVLYFFQVFSVSLSFPALGLGLIGIGSVYSKQKIHKREGKLIKAAGNIIYYLPPVIYLTVTLLDTIKWAF